MGRLRRLDGPLCRRCGRSWEGPEACCPRCRSGLSPVDLVRAVFPYRTPLPPLLYAFKYGGRLWVGKALADWMAGAFRLFDELGGADALVPVPLHPARQRQRGFNQARFLAEAVSRASGLPVLDALSRLRNTRAQSRLSRRERAGRLKGVFAPASKADVRGLDLVLIDDVCTSGATLSACATALRSGGASSIRGFALARG
ncbi:MAG: ComF family protein [Elusimicrobia bacterium]|nr:ComF family protein [Elusimicrobiota bacterium]